MEIRTQSAQQIRAATWLPYRGWTISLSNIPCLPELVVWKGDDNIHPDFPTHEPTVEGVIAAKEFIDKMEDEGTIHYETEGMTHLRRLLNAHGLNETTIMGFKTCLITLEREGFHLTVKGTNQ